MNNYLKILKELESLNEQIIRNPLENLEQEIIGAQHIFLAGAGRSGLMISAFANRLMHLGFPVSMIGEITAPHSKSGDLMIVGSGSGETTRLINQVKIAKRNGVKIVIVTAKTDSTLANLADIVINIPSLNSDVVSKQPMGSLFEQACLIIFDSLILNLMKKLNEDSQSMRKRHADIE